jgi:hypothetical protein
MSKVVEDQLLHRRSNCPRTAKMPGWSHRWQISISGPGGQVKRNHIPTALLRQSIHIQSGQGALGMARAADGCCRSA